MFIPALIGGAVAGFLSAIPFFNCLCCIWIIGGAMLAAYLLAKDYPVALSAGDGALVGIFTGIIAAAVQAFVNRWKINSDVFSWTGDFGGGFFYVRSFGRNHRYIHLREKSRSKNSRSLRCFQKHR